MSLAIEALLGGKTLRRAFSEANAEMKEINSRANDSRAYRVTTDGTFTTTELYPPRTVILEVKGWTKK